MLAGRSSSARPPTSSSDGRCRGTGFGPLSSRGPIVAAPLAAVCLRLTARLTVDELDADYVGTAIAKGVPYAAMVRRHAARGAYPGVTSLVWAYIPVFVTNVVFVEWVWNVPGFWFAMRRALDQDPFFPGIDVPMLKALSLWTALVIVVLSSRPTSCSRPWTRARGSSSARSYRRTSSQSPATLSAGSAKTTSWPGPHCTVSRSPRTTLMRSLPGPPEMVSGSRLPKISSLPEPPAMWSKPRSPVMWSSPASPKMRSSPERPAIVSLPGPPCSSSLPYSPST